MLDFVQKRLYLEEKGYLPEEYSPGSDGDKQFRYSPRYKESREYFEQFRKRNSLGSGPIRGRGVRKPTKKKAQKN